jgi:hypothetical protein
MKCRECHDLLQRCLDERRIAPSPEMREHLRECEACRRNVAAAHVLLGGLTAFGKPETTTLMTASIAAAVKADRQARRRRATYRWYAISGLAACLMLFFGMGWLAPTAKTKDAPIAKNPEPPPATAELVQRAGDAQKSVALLTKSVAEGAKSRVHAFLPEKGSLDVNLPKLPEFDEPFDPAAQSLKQAGLSVAHSFEPVTQTTMRAFGFFAREMPVIEFSKN